jgi:HAD superfamily hydrolase (TIGR01549 family)
MQPERAIFFDLDNTLFDDQACIAMALANVHADICAFLPGVDAATLSKAYLNHSDAYWVRQPYARGDLDEVRRSLWRMALLDLGCEDQDCADQAADSYRRGRSSIYQLYDDVEDVLTRLCGTYKLAVITNGAGEHQRGRLRASGLDRHFDLVVASTDLDSGKPEPAIFRHALEKLDVKPESAWHIGDSLIHDVAGAHNAGLTSVWLNRQRVTSDASQPQPDHEIASLLDIEALLERSR